MDGSLVAAARDSATGGLERSGMATVELIGVVVLKWKEVAAAAVFT